MKKKRDFDLKKKKKKGLGALGLQVISIHFQNIFFLVTFF